MNNEVVIGGMYRHFKGFIAKVITIATHTETGEILVVYECTNSENHEAGIYARPMEMFLSEVDHNKYPDVKQKYRFELTTADVQEVRHGQWQKHYKSGTTVSDGFVSSCCDMWNERETPYCPHCGARMNEKDGEE